MSQVRLNHERLQEAQRALGVKAVILSSYHAIAYYARAPIESLLVLPDRAAYAIIPSQGDPVLLVCNIETLQVRSQTLFSQVREYVEFRVRPQEALAELMSDLGLDTGAIGIEFRRLPYETATMISRGHPRVELVSIDDTLESIQLIKSQDDQEEITRAAQVTRKALYEALASYHPGFTELDMKASILSSLARFNSTPLFVFFAAGPETMHAHPDGKPEVLHEGSVWRTDLGARFDRGINSDIARCGVIGDANKHQRISFGRLAAGRDAAFKAIRPGATAGAVYLRCAEAISRAGSKLEGPHIGHAISIGVHEAPILEPGNAQVLQEGMLLDVEPKITDHERSEAFHTEDLVLVTADGCLPVTGPQSELISLS